MSNDGRRHLLLVNPSARGGKARELIAGVEAGETPVVMSGDGLIGQIGGAWADHRRHRSGPPGAN
jgi:hypothetical protein